MPITKPALRSLRNDLIAGHQRDASVKVDTKVLDQIVAIVGDDAFTSSTSVADKLRDGNLLPEEKLALARKGLDSGEKADVEALLADPQLAPLLDPVATNFLKALVGLEPLRPVDGVAGDARVDTVGSVAQSPEAKAVGKMRELIKTNQLNAYYSAVSGKSDQPALKAEAEKLFDSLPKITAETSVEDFVALGLWTTEPRGIEAMQRSARYLPGRQVIVPCKVNGDIGAGRDFLSYQEDGIDALTYRATLVGEEDDSYLVKVDGKDEPLAIPKADVHRLNQPQAFSGDVINLSKTVDYNSKYMKAKLCEAAIKTDEYVQKLDFTKMKTETADGAIGAIFGRGAGARDMVEVQRGAVRVIHDVIKMQYPRQGLSDVPGFYGGSDAGRLAIRGIGSCYMQASVMLGMLLPFCDKLGVDVQFVSGGVYREVKTERIYAKIDGREQVVDSAWPRGDGKMLVKRWGQEHEVPASDVRREKTTAEDQKRSYANEAHGWLHLIYRPAMELRICDRTWSQPDHSADAAYSRGGDRYPTSFYRSGNTKPLSPTDENFSGEVSVATFDRQFGVVGRDGRENHMSLSDLPDDL